MKMYFYLRQFRVLFVERFYCTQASIKKQKKKTFQHTVLLPQTNFPSYLKGKEIVKRDKKVQEDAQFLNLYAWQRNNLKGKEFVLHDGPPYANGKPHIGHAINKILKDIILRSQIIQGNRVHYIPGWDCHGLPIELIALKNVQNPSKAVEIRNKAREVALSMSQIQKEAFKEWGVLGNWDKECYYTFDVNYVVNQLQVFWEIYERGLIYYGLKPVFWSPSSKTALAEAELIYKEHISNAVTVRLETTQNYSAEPLYLLIWTTTPWTLPLNQGVYYSDSIKYSIIKIDSFSGLYIIASDLIADLQKKLQKNITVHSDITSNVLKNLSYKHPWNKNKILKVYESSIVTLSGTGLLHTVPAHGFEDFLLGLQNNLPVECCVDENGCYTSDAGDLLANLFVLNEGSSAVIKHLSFDIVLTEEYNHNYPYDWRTNLPVIIRASNQWFIDTNKLKDKALNCLKDIDVATTHFHSYLKNRHYWCISRQRVWGVPIPVFFHKKSNRPLVSKRLVHHLCQLFESFGPDIWWTGKLDELFPDYICQELFVQREDIIKGQDIMDIWFDSGISWSYVLNGKISELYLEGSDQYSGWFQSSLLTSVAVNNGAPFKRILTHGFAVDEDGKKMSKSLGNVVDPEVVLKGEKPFGVDTLRWWVGNHSHHALVKVSDAILKSSSERVQKIRTVLRFLLGALDSATPEDLMTCIKPQVLDTYILNSCYNLFYSVMRSYNNYDIHKVGSEILFFVPNEISSRYVSVIKDRLYCDARKSHRRKACLYTINALLQTLCHVIAPILPHLAEEVLMHHPVYGEKKLFFNEKPWTPLDFWRNSSSDRTILLLDNFKKTTYYEKDCMKMSCTLTVEEDSFQLLKKMQNDREESNDSEITEILQVAEVKLKIGHRNVTFSPTNASKCPRCRRYTSPLHDQLCTRCEKVVSNLVSNNK